MQRRITWIAGLPGDFDEAVIQREIVADGILPSGEFLSVIGKLLHDELADLR